ALAERERVGREARREPELEQLLVLRGVRDERVEPVAVHRDGPRGLPVQERLDPSLAGEDEVDVARLVVEPEARAAPGHDPLALHAPAPRVRELVRADALREAVRR